MSDYLTLAIMASIAISCGASVLLFDALILPALKELHRTLAEQLHRDGADSDRSIFGDVPNVPDDFPVFHSRGIRCE